MDWARMLAYVTGTVDQELLARNEYLAAENRIMKAQLIGRLKLSDAERGALGEIGHRLGRKVLAESRPSPDRTPSWAGTASLLPASSMARRRVEARADHESSERSSS
jgi:putative transposase